MIGLQAIQFLLPQVASISELYRRRNCVILTPTPNITRLLLRRRILLGCRSFHLQKSSAQSAPQNPTTNGMVEVVSVPKSGEMAGNPSPPHKISSIMLVPSPLKRLSQMAPADQASLLLGVIAFMMSGALLALLATAIPTLNAMRRAALSLERLADTAREELPGTMAAIRLSGMEISDLTLELSDMSQEISEGVRSSARALRAAEVGIRRMGSFTASETLSLLQERASMPVEAVKPMVATAAESTWQAVTQAQRAVSGLAALPVLSKWIQKKNFEEQKKIEEDMGDTDDTTSEEDSGKVVISEV